MLGQVPINLLDLQTTWNSNQIKTKRIFNLTLFTNVLVCAAVIFKFFLDLDTFYLQIAIPIFGGLEVSV